MLARVSILLEVAAIIVCIHRLYNRKVKFDIATIVLYLSCVIIPEIENAYSLGFIYTAVTYMLVTMYCMRRYEDSILGGIYCMLLAIIVVVAVQFFFTVFIDLFWDVNEAKRAIITNVLALGNITIIMPKLEMHRLRTHVKRWNRNLFVLLAFPLCMVFSMQFQQRKLGGIQIPLFIFVMPMLALLLVLMGAWLTEQNEKSDIEAELKITKSMQVKYDELVNAIRLRQHEFKNHLAAVFASHYTYKSYDELVKAQEQYMKGLQQENKYNDLLVLGDTVLVGFLHEKFREIEANGVAVEFKILGSMKESCIAVYHLVEMTGILLDNASQAVQGTDLYEVIKFEFIEDKEEVHFIISNPFPYVNHDEIDQWFQIDKSTKGKGRGLGLCRVRNLCKEKGCSISCRNIEIEGINWIEFMLSARKADRP